MDTITSSSIKNISDGFINESNIPCVSCNKSPKTKGYMLQHKESKNDKANNVVCSICNMICNIPCVSCNKAFKTHEDMLQHKAATHDTEKKFGCDRCNMLFPDILGVTQHYYDRHCNTCSECGEDFQSKNYLIEHASNGHGKKWYSVGEKDEGQG
jgi:uncharacterized C2H2 Zn-finger protein